jgi:hypothetical protein
MTNWEKFLSYIWVNKAVTLLTNLSQFINLKLYVYMLNSSCYSEQLGQQASWKQGRKTSRDIVVTHDKDNLHRPVCGLPVIVKLTSNAPTLILSSQKLEAYLIITHKSKHVLCMYLLKTV